VGLFTVLGPLLHGFLAVGGNFCLSLHPGDSIELEAPKLLFVEPVEAGVGKWADFL